MRNNSVCPVKNILSRTVIFFKSYYFCTLIMIFKRKDVFNRSATKTVNTLVVVAYNTNIFIFICKKRGQNVLRMVSILILVNHNILKLSLINIANVLIFLKKLNGVKNNIVKVHCVRFFKLSLI